MTKKMNMLALIVLLIAQTMLAPIAVTAQGVLGEENDLTENLGGVSGIQTDESERNDPDGETEPQENVADAEAITENEASTDPIVNIDKNGQSEAKEIAREMETFSANVLSEPDTQAVITENIIDEMVLLKKDGTKFEEGELIAQDEDLRLELTWSLPDDPIYVGGDTFEFQLPEQLEIYGVIEGDLDDYGTYLVTMDGKVTFTFNEQIDNNSEVYGTFWVETVLDKQKIHTTTEILEIKVNEDVVTKITVNLKPEDGQAIHKEGQPVNGNFNTEEIQWTVLINTTRESLQNAIVTDPILAGQELDVDSIQLKEVEVDLQGNVVDEQGEVTDFTNLSTKELLNISLGDTNKAYQLTFKTKMKEAEKDKEGWQNYSNTAYLDSDGKDKTDSGASVSVNRPKSLVKTSSAFDREDRSVSWEIKANFTEKQLPAGTEIVDEFTFKIGNTVKNDVFTVNPADIEILQVDEFNSNGTVNAASDAKSLFDISIADNKVTFTLKEDTNSAFIINYKVTAEDGTYITHDGTISNRVELDGKVDTSSQFVPQQVGVKTNSGINYRDKTIDWTIQVNADEQDLRNFVLTDDFSGSGQQLVEDSITVDPSIDSNKIIPETDGEGFTINFGDITDSYTITYQTKFTYDFEGEKTPDFHNDVNIKFEIDHIEYELEIDDGEGPNPLTKNNGAKNGTVNHATKEITWAIDINYNDLILTNAKVVDHIAANQSLKDGSVKIYETSINVAGNITKGNDVTADFDITTDENLVEVLFNGEIDRSYRIEFITVDKDGVYNRGESYENTAEFIPRPGEKHELDAHVKLPNQGEFLGKTGVHNKEDWTADWKIDVNQSRSELTDVTVEDDLGDGTLQILLKDTIKVTKANSDDELAADQYELTVEGNKFTVKFPGVINEAYEIKYSSYIVAEDDAKISNTAEIQSVVEEIVGFTEKEEEIEVKISTGGGTAQGVTGGLILEKVEKETGRALPGIRFTLEVTIFGETIVVRQDTTNAEGKIHWNGLRYGEYTLKEDIPEGYTGTASQPITISNATTVEGFKTKQVENERQKGTVKIIKVDAATGEQLPHAVFEIKNLTTDQEYTLTTKADGTISEDVPFGEYSIIEVTAPNGYRITENIDHIIVEVDQTTEVTVENVAFVDIEGEKTWLQDVDLPTPESITVQLLKNGNVFAERTVSSDDDWKYSFTDLDKYDENGQEIIYEIEETDIAGYISVTNGFDLINIQQIDITGTKIWEEVDAQYRPDSIIVNLFGNNEMVDHLDVEGEQDEDEWTFTFADLPKYDLTGELIDYTIKEEAINGYSSYENNEIYEIINTQITTEISGTKTWKDNDNITEDRPGFIIVQVLNNTEIIQEQEVKADENDEWHYTFTNLPKFDQEGHEIQYTINELPVPGYQKDVNGFDITNTRADILNVTGKKTWQDDQNATNDRPESITIVLYANGVQTDTIEVTAETDWEYIFENLEAYDEDGVAITYTIGELDVEGYESAVNGFDLTNTRTGVTSVAGTKTWLDTNTDERPSFIIVDLLQNGEKIAEVRVSAHTNWKYSFTDLAAFDESGAAYTYTVAEQNVPDGYTATVDGYDITNTSETYLLGDGGKSEGPMDADDSQLSGDGGNLPKTATNIFNLILIGFGLVCVSFVLLARRRSIE